MSNEKVKQIHFVGIAPWRVVPEKPRHNTIHQAIYRAGISEGLNMTYLGLEKTFEEVWISQVLPDSILRPFPIMKFREMKRAIAAVRISHDERVLFYLYEGSFSWAMTLKLLSCFIRSSIIVCNLFPASKYKAVIFGRSSIKLRYRLLFWIFSKFNNVFFTVDTNSLANQINSQNGSHFKVDVFPLPSAFEIVETVEKRVSEHKRVLVNVRNYSINQIQDLLANSCGSCSFTFPEELHELTRLNSGLNRYSNAVFESSSIPVDSYRDYIDSFDYMIFLYAPSEDTSGKILDAITRRVPVCLPYEASEWVDLSTRWNKSFLFSHSNFLSARQAFNHPRFQEPLLDGEPRCTPRNMLLDLSKYGETLPRSPRKFRFKFALALHLLVGAHYFFGFFLGKVFSAKIKVKRFIFEKIL